MTFRTLNRQWHLLFALIYLFGIIFLFQKNASSNLFKEYPALIFLIIILLVALFRGISVHSYKLVVNDNGEISEKELFHSTRNLQVNEITNIRPKAYESNRIKGYRLNMKIEAPRFDNQKYKVFPRYAVSKSVIQLIQKLNPNVNIDPNYLEIKP